MDARHRQRRRTVDRQDLRGWILRRQDSDMKRAFRHDVGNIIATAGDEPAILANPAVGRDKTECSGIDAHFTISSTTLAERGALDLRTRSAANSIASTIWPYPVQRQILPEMASTISSRLGS